MALGYSPSQPVASVLSVSFMSAESHHSEGHSPSEGQSSHDGELDETLQSEVINAMYTLLNNTHAFTVHVYMFDRTFCICHL